MKELTVYLVGAGPGDPSLLTLAAVRRLKQADCVIYDGLVNPAVLQYVRPGAEKICVRKRTGPSPADQQSINKLLVEKARCCRCVVRLKGGDPVLFARAAEELEALVKAGISFEIVPGITAALAASAYCGIILTDRLISSQLLFVSGKESPDKSESMIDWKLLADFNGSLVFYMAMSALDEIVQKLLRYGKAADTPVAVVGNATLPTQRLLRSTIAKIIEDSASAAIGPPAVLIIGQAANCPAKFNWFQARPLFGKRIGITRDGQGNERFSQMLRDCAAEPVRFDSVEIQDFPDNPDLISALQNPDNFQWVVFTSANGVKYTFKAVERIGKDARVFGKAKLACIGSATAEKLADFGLRADIVPPRFTSVALAEAIISHFGSGDKNILLLRSAIAPDDLPDRLKKAGANVRQVCVYTVQPRIAGDAEKDDFLKRLQTGLDWLTFTSASTVRSFFEQFSPELVKSCPVKIASIGPAASEQLKILGLDVHLEAKTHTIAGLIDSLIQYYDSARTEYSCD